MTFHHTMIFIISLFAMSCQGQTLPDPEILSEDFSQDLPFYYGMPNSISSQDTSPLFNKSQDKILLTGKVYECDGKTPAAEVLLYYYQTDEKGVYARDRNEPRNMPKNSLGQSHGYIRGWVKTDHQGNYSIYTSMPGSYPNSRQPAHIHVTAADPRMDEPYYIDDFVFDDDPFLTKQERMRKEKRGGSGIIRFVEHEDLKVGERNIYLGSNIPNYPCDHKTRAKSGPEIGEDIFSFTPFHAFGEDEGSTACPVCKYGWYQGVLYFVGNNPDWEEVEKWLVFFEKESQKRKEYLKVYFIYGDELSYNKEKRKQELKSLGTKLQLEKVALTFVPSFHDTISEIHLNNINPDVKKHLPLVQKKQYLPEIH